MVRLWGLFLVCLLFIAPRVSAGDTPILTINAPKQAVAGTTFTVKVDITRGDVEGIARYQLSVPVGVSIEPGECANADFEFINQSLRLMWYRIPKSSSLSFSFNVVTHQNVRGKLNIDGSFIMVTPSNSTKNLDSTAVSVDITASPNIDPRTVVDLGSVKGLKTNEDRALTFVPASQQMASVVMVSNALRQGPIYDERTNSYLVSILLDKGKATKYAKLEEEIPAGFTAEPVETRSGVFDFKNGKVKFLWLELPQEPRYLVSYRLRPIKPMKEEIKFNLSGYFAFINGETTEVHEVAQVQNSNSINLNYLAEIRGSMAQSAARDIPIKYVGIAKQATSAPSKPTEKRVIKETKTPTTDASQPKDAATQANKAPKKSSTEAVAAKKSEGVVYRVQLAAVSKEADRKGAGAQYQQTFGVSTKEESNGLIRYLVGPFSTIEEAQRARDNAISKGAEGAFIAAYNGKGERIPISEALRSNK